MDLYYKITESGYHIYDRNDPYFHIHQYEPYIPDSTKTYEKNAQMQIERLTTEPTRLMYTLDEASAIITSEVSE